MSASEKLSILGDFRKVLQDFLAPEMGELKTKLQALSDNQKSMAEEMRGGFKTQAEDMREGFKAQTESRQEMESRLLREIKNSEEKLLMRIQLAETTLKLEQANVKLGEAARIAEGALRENEQLKREKTQ